MNLNSEKMKNKIGFSEYEYNRLNFINEVIRENKSFKYIGDNLNFFSNIGKMNILSNNLNKFDMVCGSLEFFEAYDKFLLKFRRLYEGSKEHLVIDKKMTEDLYFVYLPLARHLYKASYDKKYTPIICGIQAHQGCGKTTLCNILRYLLEDIYELKTGFLSIDDLYSTYSELADLKKSDSRFKYRGPPGTHDLQLGLSTLENVKNSKINFSLPRYNKSANKGLGDRAETGELVKKPIDVFIFEGWFLGADPVEEKDLEAQQKDKNKLEFQKEINRLLYNYTPLWDYVDYWIVMKPKKYKYSRKWRVQAEKDNKQGMSWKQVNEFVDYFWLAVPPKVYLENIEKKRNPLLILTLDKHRNFYI